MEIIKKLKDQGWYLTEEGLKKITSEPGVPETDVKKIIEAAKDWDFREIAIGALPTKRDADTLPGRIVLQIQKIRNIAAPKANEESKTAPRFLQVDFSDGQTLLQGLELEPIPLLSLDVPPGTKVYFRAERLTLMQGFVVLKAADLQVLGGRVEHLVDKWELARTMLKYARSGRRVSGSSGPPPWLAFGKKLEMKETFPTDRNFKSLQAATQDKDKEGGNSKENEEFIAMRTVAIAEAAKAGAKKIFGGGNQQMLDHNMKKILEKGYSEEDATNSLRSTNNNLERALYNLKRRDDYRRNDDRMRSSVESMPATNGKLGGRGSSTRELGGGGKRGAASAKDEANAAKPAANVSLFDFLTDILPANSDSAAAATAAANTQPSSASYTSNTRFEKSKSDVVKSSNAQKNLQDSTAASSRPKFENNLSSSFAANRSTPNAPRNGRNDRSEREPYNAAERQTNTRYSSTRGGGGRGGRGGGGYQGGNRAPYEETAGSRNYQAQQQRSTGGAAASGSAVTASETAPRNPNNPFRNNPGLNNNQRNSNRASHERSTATSAATTQSGNEKQQPAGSLDNRRTHDYQHKGNEKPRYNQKDNNSQYQGSSNRNYDSNNASRQQNSYAASNSNANNNASSTATPATTTNNANNNSNATSTDHAARVNKLVESTSKLKIDKSRCSGRNQQQQRQHNQSQQYSQQQQQQQMQPVMPQQYQHPAAAATHPQMHRQQMLKGQAQTANFTQLPNGFTYDPSKIIGFQSKETNEFAMTLLKSQGMTTVPPQGIQQAPQQQTATHYVPSASPLQMPPQPPSPFAAPSPFMLPTPQQTAAPGGYGMMSSGDGWMWKIGDLCLAKYWDDGRYYEAEITGISERTCVVFFLGYGNHEEVLKIDCLPVTDANHRPINKFSSNQQQHAAATQQTSAPPPPPAMHVGSASQSRGVPNRYRGERQVYVPPPKRDN